MDGTQEAVQYGSPAGEHRGIAESQSHKPSSARRFKEDFSNALRSLGPESTVA